MPPRKYTLKTIGEHAGMRLDHALAEWLPKALAQPLSKARVRMLIVAGAVYLNGKRVRIASKTLIPGAKIDVFVDMTKLQAKGPSQDRRFEMTASHILYEDEFLIAVNKPPGLPTQPTLDEARDNLFAAVKKFLAARDGGQPYVGLHHRLDRDTSGVILFTKKAEANAGTADLFASHKARKTYQALSLGRAREPREWSVKNYLAKAKGGGKQSRFQSVRSGGDFAHTDFKILEVAGPALLIEARPLTGRTHQIRVHLSEGGLPILGDATYGGAQELPGGSRVPRLMLHAVNLTFPHPVHQNQVSVTSPVPEDFTRCLQTLRNGRGG
ncbi:MAG: RluA family pseudouridine synthase [Bdellovibrionota bacterium]